jgi:CRP-like cAMP-binding protein
MFGKQSTSRLRQLACVMEHLQYEEGETIFSQGDAPDGVYMIDEGFCSVEVDGMGTVATLSVEGMVFGELALFLDDVRTATIRAQCPMRLLRMATKDVMEVLKESWGDEEELEARATCVHRAPIIPAARFLDCCG